MSSSLGVHAVGLTKRFGTTAVLESVTLAVPAHSLVAVTGANGAGKTTLLRVFATLLRADEGTATVNGFDVQADPASVRSSIGVALVNERALYWRLSGRANLKFFARVAGLDVKTASRRMESLISQLGLSEVIDRRVAGWSAGQRQRLILARALIGEPVVLLVDEPMRGLDSEGIGRVRDLLRTTADAGATVIVAGPTIEEFRDLCDEVVVLDHGRLTEKVPGHRPKAGAPR